MSRDDNQKKIGVEGFASFCMRFLKWVFFTENNKRIPRILKKNRDIYKYNLDIFTGVLFLRGEM
jgi:hypothetical protein